MTTNDLILRKASIADVKPIHAMLLQTSKEGLLLPRPLSELYNHIREFFVFESVADQEMLGCCALSIVWEDLAEIRSLVVKKELRGHSLGKQLVDRCLSEARELGLTKVFTLTYQDVFFEKIGFKTVSKDILPNKVWADCIHCPKFPDCDEIAMIQEL